MSDNTKKKPCTRQDSKTNTFSKNNSTEKKNPPVPQKTDK